MGEGSGRWSGRVRLFVCNRGSGRVGSGQRFAGSGPKKSDLWTTLSQMSIYENNRANLSLMNTRIIEQISHWWQSGHSDMFRCVCIHLFTYNRQALYRPILKIHIDLYKTHKARVNKSQIRYISSTGHMLCDFIIDFCRHELKILHNSRYIPLYCLCNPSWTFRAS